MPVRIQVKTLHALQKISHRQTDRQTDRCTNGLMDGQNQSFERLFRCLEINLLGIPDPSEMVYRVIGNVSPSSSPQASLAPLLTVERQLWPWSSVRCNQFSLNWDQSNANTEADAQDAGGSLVWAHPGASDLRGLWALGKPRQCQGVGPA